GRTEVYSPVPECLLCRTTEGKESSTVIDIRNAFCELHPDLRTRIFDFLCDFLTDSQSDFPEFLTTIFIRTVDHRVDRLTTERHILTLAFTRHSFLLHS